MPESTPFHAPSGAPVDGPKRIRTRHFSHAKANGLKITAMTSYDVLTASIFDRAGIDVLLVGDSAASTVFGYESTLRVSVDELIPLAAAVVRGAERALVVADLPFGSYESGPDEALRTAVRFMREAGVHAVKLEGGERSAAQIERITQAGIPVMGHVGFTPQSEHGLGGHVIQGRGDAVDRLLADGRAVEAAGAFAVVLELVPSSAAAAVTQTLTIPTIGIGAGPDCDGQILVWQDWAGLTQGRVPSFVSRYLNLAEQLTQAAAAWRADVSNGTYPGPEHSYS